MTTANLSLWCGVHKVGNLLDHLLIDHLLMDASNLVVAAICTIGGQQGLVSPMGL